MKNKATYKLIIGLLLMAIASSCTDNDLLTDMDDDSADTSATGLRFTLSEASTRLTYDDLHTYFADGETIGCVLATVTTTTSTDDDGNESTSTSYSFLANSKWTYNKTSGALVAQQLYTGTTDTDGTVTFTAIDPTDTDNTSSPIYTDSSGFLAISSTVTAPVCFFFYYPFVEPSYTGTTTGDSGSSTTTTTSADLTNVPYLDTTSESESDGTTTRTYLMGPAYSETKTSTTTPSTTTDYSSLVTTDAALFTEFPIFVHTSQSTAAKHNYSDFLWAGYTNNGTGVTSDNLSDLGTQSITFAKKTTTLRVRSDKQLYNVHIVPWITKTETETETGTATLTVSTTTGDSPTYTLTVSSSEGTGTSTECTITPSSDNTTTSDDSSTSTSTTTTTSTDSSTGVSTTTTVTLTVSTTTSTSTDEEEASASASTRDDDDSTDTSTTTTTTTTTYTIIVKEESTSNDSDTGAITDKTVVTTYTASSSSTTDSSSTDESTEEESTSDDSSSDEASSDDTSTSSTSLTATMTVETTTVTQTPYSIPIGQKIDLTTGTLTAYGGSTTSSSTPQESLYLLPTGSTPDASTSLYPYDNSSAYDSSDDYPYEYRFVLPEQSAFDGTLYFYPSDPDATDDEGNKVSVDYTTQALTDFSSTLSAGKAYTVNVKAREDYYFYWDSTSSTQTNAPDGVFTYGGSIRSSETVVINGISYKYSLNMNSTGYLILDLPAKMKVTLYCCADEPSEGFSVYTYYENYSSIPSDKAYRNETAIHSGTTGSGTPSDAQEGDSYTTAEFTLNKGKYIVQRSSEFHISYIVLSWTRD